jgi:hypothetical protein
MRKEECRKGTSYTAGTTRCRRTVNKLSFANNTELQCLSFKPILSYWPSLLSSGQGSVPQIRRSGFDSLRYQICWKVVGLKRGQFCLVSTNEELLGRKSSGSDLENWEYGRRNPSRWTRDTFYIQKLALTSPTSGGRSRTKTTKFSFCLVLQNSFAFEMFFLVFCSCYKTTRIYSMLTAVLSLGNG